MDTVKMWVGYWDKWEPDKPYLEKVIYGLRALRDQTPYSSRRWSISNVISHALGADYKFSCATSTGCDCWEQGLQYLCCVD